MLLGTVKGPPPGLPLPAMAAYPTFMGPSGPTVNEGSPTSTPKGPSGPPTGSGQASASVDAYKEMMGGNSSAIEEIQRLRDQQIVTERGAAMAKAEMAAAQKQTAEMAAKVKAHQESESTMASVLGTAVEVTLSLGDGEPGAS